MQPSLDFPHHISYSLEDFVVTNVNSLAFNKITNWPNSWNNKSYPYLLLLLGSKQSGKTHLAHIWQNHSKAIFVTPQTISKCLNISSTNLIIEDIDTQNFSEKDLLTLFNICNERQNYCLFTSSSFPHQLKLPDLVSRMKSIDICKINMPDKETIKVILSKEFTTRSLQIEVKLINLLAELIPLNFHSAYNAVNLLNTTSLQENKPITSALIKKLFLGND